MYRILVSDKLSEKGLAVFRAESDITTDVRLDLTPEQLREAIADYDALVVRSGTQVTQAVLSNAKRLKVIGRAGVGLDNIDIPAATRAGIIVMNTPDGNTISAAEHTVAMILALARNIPQAHMSMKQDKWERAKFMGVELFGKTLGVIGLGRIGAEVAKRAQAFGMKILAFDPFSTQERAQKLGIELTDIPTILKCSDFITVHVPKTKETTGLIGKKELASLKPGVRLVNVARGGIYDEAALVEGLTSGAIGGVALDVFDTEPPKRNALWDQPNAIMTPHLGASTEEAQENVAAVVARQIVDALRGNTILNAVNMPAIDAESWKSLEPYHKLVELLARFMSQFTEAMHTRISLTYSGEVAQLNTHALTLAALKDLLHSYSETVNFVNAPVIAKERGVEVKESTTQDAEDFTSLITLDVEGKQGKHSVCGTLVGHREPRIVSIDGYRVDIEPKGNLILFFNRDTPGVVGKVGMILGSARVNIAGLTNGRKERGGEAVSVINVDEDVSKSTLDEIAAIEGLKNVSLIRLG